MTDPAPPFPLASGSSHHSLYHRFLLGADAAVIAPLPKPRCCGKVAPDLGPVALHLNLQRWRRLYGGALPWVPGFGGEHYDPGTVGPHRRLPAAYARPRREFAAFDLVAAAEPAYSALALVAGDRRLVDRFGELASGFCARVEAGVAAVEGPTGAVPAGRMLAGLFVEPNNRWLMPLLHAHARVLNLTSLGDAPLRLRCVDPGSLADGALRAGSDWRACQAAALEAAGYRVRLTGGRSAGLQVEGVCGRLLSLIQAPRLAVLELLQRIIAGERKEPGAWTRLELPEAVVAALAEQLETLVARSAALRRPAKLGLPSEGPWRAAVRDHLGRHCPEGLAALDAAAAAARAEPLGGRIFPCPPPDAAHGHGLVRAERAAEPEILAAPHLDGAADPGPWLADAFALELARLHAFMSRGPWERRGADLAEALARLDRAGPVAGPQQARQVDLLLGVEIERRGRAILGCGGSLDPDFGSPLLAAEPAARQFGDFSL